MIDGSKRVKSAKDVHFGGFIRKFRPPPSPSIPKTLYYRSCFSLQAQILAEAPPKFVFE